MRNIILSNTAFRFFIRTICSPNTLLASPEFYEWLSSGAIFGFCVAASNNAQGQVICDTNGPLAKNLIAICKIKNKMSTEDFVKK